MAVSSGAPNDDGRDATVTDHRVDPEVKHKDAGKGDSSLLTAPTAGPSDLSPPSRAAIVLGPSDPKQQLLLGLPKSKSTDASRHSKPVIAASSKNRRPPVSRTATAAANRSRLKKMSTASGSLSPLSQASEAAMSASLEHESSRPDSENDSVPIEIDGDDDDIEVEEDEDGAEAGSKRKLTSAVWKDFKRVKFNGTIRAKCNYCFKKLSAASNNGTKHLHVHLKSCVQKKIKQNGKTLAQAALRFDRTDAGTVSVENYTFDQEIARKELSAMIVLHEYPLSMVDHVGFRRFVGALQPLFKIGTRNTIRSDIIKQYEVERKKAIEYMAGIQSRVAVTTDMWTSDNQKRGYMAITAHFIDESWTLRNIIMRFIYVPAPHTAEIIGEELYQSLVEWNLDEKISSVTLDNCTTNDASMRKPNNLPPFGLVSRTYRRAFRNLQYDIYFGFKNSNSGDLLATTCNEQVKYKNS